jgi:single-strand DNA-binding protein
MSFNKVILQGNLTRDPEMRYLPKGTAVCKFSLAVNRKWKDESGQPKEEVTFIEVDSFGRQAETIGQYFKKGMPILLEGRLKMDQWEDKTTKEKRSRLGVVMESFTFLGGGNSKPAEQSASRFPSNSEMGLTKDQPVDDDVPF